MDYETFYQRLRDPDLIPGYEILQKIGGGVFGEVFKCRKTSIARIYVVKFLKLDSDAQRAIIEKELAQLRNFAQIDHPNLVGIEDQGTVHEIPYIIMTFGGDETLQDRTGQGAMTGEALVDVFDQILAGVAALHERSIVHFDLKPANIFIRETAVRVGDYGLSKMLTESRQSLSFGRGTPYYMAPEVMRRKGDLRADVYSLGAILFELATGRVPFDGESDWEVLRKHEVAPVPFPDDLDPRLRPLIERAMQKDPDARYASAVEFRAAFRAVFGRETTEMAIPVETIAASARVVGATESSVGSAADRVNRLARARTSRIRDRLATTGGGLSAPVRPAAGAAVAPRAATPAAPRPAEASESDAHPPVEPPAAPRPSRGRRWLHLVLLIAVFTGVLVAVMTPRRAGVSSSDAHDAAGAEVIVPVPTGPEPGRDRMRDLERIREQLEQGGPLSDERAEEVKAVLQGLHMWFNDQAKMIRKIESLVQDRIGEPEGGGER